MRREWYWRGLGNLLHTAFRPKMRRAGWNAWECSTCGEDAPWLCCCGDVPEVEHSEYDGTCRECSDPWCGGCLYGGFW